MPGAAGLGKLQPLLGLLKMDRHKSERKADLVDLLKGVAGGMLVTIAGAVAVMLLYFLLLPANFLLSVECKITRVQLDIFASRDSCNRTFIRASAVPVSQTTLPVEAEPSASRGPIAPVFGRGADAGQ
ncbi:hypothetical protein BN961_00380 [Afipia felis]|uniref:Uncharacterized protein n=1 Tax=Afipia felis TaxID=1035 RepID=A0A090MMV6_AFIFE|nr:hypothetical protein BN961_00380 [Afipia felis]